MNNKDDKLNISAVVFTRNEEMNIERCLDSLNDFMEVVVVDSSSQDMTIPLAIGKGARVIEFVWNGRYPKKRQWTLENVDFKSEWILFVDADERVPQVLIDELKSLDLTRKDYAGGILELDYFFSGKRLRFGQRPRKVALMRPNNVKYPKLNDLGAPGMGELEGHYQPLVNGKLFKLNERMVHDDLDPLTSWMNRHVKYAEWEAYVDGNPELRSEVLKLKTPIGRFFHNMPFKPLVFFLNSYLIRLGFLDGKSGFDFAFSKAWYYWLINRIKAGSK